MMLKQRHKCFETTRNSGSFKNETFERRPNKGVWRTVLYSGKSRWYITMIRGLPCPGCSRPTRESKLYVHGYYGSFSHSPFVAMILFTPIFSGDWCCVFFHGSEAVVRLLGLLNPCQRIPSQLIYSSFYLFIPCTKYFCYPAFITVSHHINSRHILAI